MNIIKLACVTMSYCHQCERPAYVGTFELTSWKHRFNLCDLCLTRMGQAVTQGAHEQLAKGSMANQEL